MDNTWFILVPAGGMQSLVESEIVTSQLMSSKRLKIRHIKIIDDITCKQKIRQNINERQEEGLKMCGMS